MPTRPRDSLSKKACHFDLSIFCAAMILSDTGFAAAETM
jgi:hypothetical protein